MIAYKKVTRDFQEFILTVRIPEWADRCVSASGKWRVSSVEVLAAEDMRGNPAQHRTFYSLYDWNFVYTVREMASSRLEASNKESGDGIHCFLSKEAARRYMKGKTHG